MRKGPLVWSLVVVAVLVAGVLVATAGFGAAPRLGLDLRGGISVVLTARTEPGTELNEEVLDETISIIRNRVDSLGVAEPEIARQGSDVLVQLPGLEDRQRALDIIGRTAKLTFRPVQAVIPPSAPTYDEVGPECTDDAAPAPAPTADGTPTAPATPQSPASTPTADATPTAAADGPSVHAAGTRIQQAQETPAGQQTPAETSTEAPSSPAPSPGATPADPAAAPEDLPRAGRAGDLLAEDQPYVLCGSPVEETGDPAAGGRPLKYVVGPAQLTGEGIDDALAVTEQTGQGAFTNNWVVQLDLTSEGGNQFAEITGQLACERDQQQPGGGRLAIVLDGIVQSAPEMNPNVQCGVGITGGSAVITVGGQESEARDLALVLKTGALPITLEPSTVYTVSPTLGSQALQAGIIAGLIGLGLVALYLMFFYRWLGAISVGGLAIFGVLIIGLITLLGEAGFTLTLAGVAGIIVSIGIAADSSILYFERITDELETGKTVRTSVRRAFGPAFRTNLTGNTVTIAAAVVLYFLAVGPVRGFAFTLGLSTILDLLILYFYTRPAVQLLGDTRLLRSPANVSALPQPEGGSR